MKFSELNYERPNLDVAARGIRELLPKLSEATSADDQKVTIEQINAIRAHTKLMYELCYIRNTINTQDEFYKTEKRFFDQNMPTMEEVETEYYQALIQSPLRTELEAMFGKQLFRIAEVAIKAFAPEIIDDLKRDNEWSTQYNDLTASAEIPFQGQTLTLSELGKYINDPDRNVRRAAQEAKYAFFSEHEGRLDEIYGELVGARTAMARKLGYKTFTELGYLKLNRTDYSPDMVSRFRGQVLKHIVPLAEKLKERQRSRIGVDKLMYYDEGFGFRSGNPTPKGDPVWIVENGKQMYEALSPETSEFFHFMVDRELMDLLSRKGKRVGGYCTVIAEVNAPFIFANFNGTAHDVTVLTHEAGHAFMGYMSRDNRVPEYDFPTLEAAEIHSMSMEFFTWPWMDLFFQEDTDKFKFQHLGDAITVIPYLVAVDEFQHFVYDHPDVSPTERKAAWREIERKYIPHRDYRGNDYLERGGYWHQQRHIFARPFYYIDYSLAQICALQFWKRMNENREDAWKDYLHLCKLAGSRSFLELLVEGNLSSPFEDGTVAQVVEAVETWLDGIDDEAL